MIDAALWADVMRWWSAGGAFLAMWPVSRGAVMTVVRWRADEEHHFVAKIFPTMFGTAALWLFLSFCLVMGAFLPLVDRFDWAQAAIGDIAAWAWTIAAVAAWTAAIGYSRSRVTSIGCAISWFAAMLFAAAASAP